MFVVPIPARKEQFSDFVAKVSPNFALQYKHDSDDRHPQQTHGSFVAKSVVHGISEVSDKRHEKDDVECLLQPAPVILPYIAHDRLYGNDSTDEAADILHSFFCDDIRLIVVRVPRVLLRHRLSRLVCNDVDVCQLQSAMRMTSINVYKSSHVKALHKIVGAYTI